MTRLSSLCAFILLGCGGPLLPGEGEPTVLSQTAPTPAALSDPSPPSLREPSVESAPTTPVLASSPRDGELGVEFDAALRLTFAEPMNLEVTGQAISIDTASGPVSGALHWNAEATEVVFRPHAPFPPGANLSWRVRRSALTARGASFSKDSGGEFRVLRVVTQVLLAVPGLQGFVDNEGWVSAGSAPMVGNIGPGRVAHGFLTFDLCQLDSTARRIVSAEMSVRLSDLAGAPSQLGALVATSVDYGLELGAEDFDTHATGENLLFSLGAPGELMTASTTANVSANFGSCNSRSQYKLSFERETLAGEGASLVWLNATTLSVTYEAL